MEDGVGVENDDVDDVDVRAPKREGDDWLDDWDRVDDADATLKRNLVVFRNSQ